MGALPVAADGRDPRAAAASPAGTTASATSRAVAELRRRIITAELRPGERLKIETLRQTLGVGASPIREALSLLTSDHLVERLDQRGFRVARASEAHFRDVLQTRCWLEDRALRESIANGATAWEEALVLAHHRLAREDRRETDDPEAPSSWEALHKRFHMALISGAGSPMLHQFCGMLYDQNVRYRYLAARSSGYASRDVSAEHAAIVEAALARDADRASQRLLAHYAATGRFLDAIFE